MRSVHRLAVRHHRIAPRIRAHHVILTALPSRLPIHYDGTALQPLPHHESTLRSFSSIGTVTRKDGASSGSEDTNGNAENIDRQALYKQYSHTLNLPKTSYKTWSNPTITEPQIQKICSELAYQSQGRSGHLGSSPFTLHDGPPYANGNLHLGHALNKILKDVVNRYKMMRGFRVHFIPGFDCHGLPIELKAINSQEDGKLSPLEIRQRAKQFARETIERQKAEFMRWGVMGDWDNHYTTMEPEFEARQLEIFLQMYEKGYIYRGERPVYWSPSSQTALAEAELEYPDDHVSKSIYVMFPIPNGSNPNNEILSRFDNLSIVIWTTTPWTLMANEAVSYHNDIEYSIVKTESSTETVHFIVAHELLPTVLQKLKGKFGKMEVVLTAKGQDMFANNARCTHPLCPTKSTPLVHGDHVTTQAGTGLVHTAPGHGMEDFLIGKQYDLPTTCPVSHDGRYTDKVLYKPEKFSGLDVLDEGNAAMIEELHTISASFDRQGSVHSSVPILLVEEDYHHKYPYDWRTKKPVIIRSTKQWFAQLQDLKSAAMKALDDVRMFPAMGRNRIQAMLSKRDEWCISRQRAWGVPIPVFYYTDSETGEQQALATRESIQYVIDKVRNHPDGTNCWFELPESELLAPQYRDNGIKYEKGMDTLDVWFDSGTTWYGVLHRMEVDNATTSASNGEKIEREHRFQHFPADLYLEGSDQHRGWFQSSLLTSVAINGKAPYRDLVTHGFTLDSQGRKMSKSVGNVVDPGSIVDGKISGEDNAKPEMATNDKSQESGRSKGKNKDKQPRPTKSSPKAKAYGADVLRLWSVSSDFSTDMLIGDTAIEKQAENQRKLRNTAKFLLGNLADFDLERDYVAYDQLHHKVDAYALHQLHQFTQEVTEHYENYAFFKVHQLIVSFTYELSASYLDIVKDRLYSEDVDSRSRRSAQTVMYHALDTLTRAIAPIMCHTAEDIFQHNTTIKRNDDSEVVSIFNTGWISVDDQWHQPELAHQFRVLLELRYKINQVIERGRADKQFGSSLETDVMLFVAKNKDSILMDLLTHQFTLEEIADLIIVSRVHVAQKQPGQTFEESQGIYAAVCELEVPATWSTQDTSMSTEGLDIIVRKATGYKCPRCWKLTAENDLDLCGRCFNVLNM